jgi:hypothetical protein
MSETLNPQIESQTRRAAIRTFFANAIAHQQSRFGKPATAARRPNRRTLPVPPETDQEELWRVFNIAVRLMDVPEAKQDAQWWSDRDSVLFTWDKLLHNRKAVGRGPLSSVSAKPQASVLGRQPDVSSAVREVEKLRELRYALQFFLDAWLRLVNSGDAGSWNPEDDDCVKLARAALD